MNLPIVLILDRESGKYYVAPAFQGAPGTSIESITIDEKNHLIVTLTDGTTKDAGELPSGGGGGAVLSVNEKTGEVVLNAEDVGADPAGTAQGLIDALEIPENLADLAGDADHRTVTDKEKQEWSGKEEAGTAQKLVDALVIPNVPDWALAPNRPTYTYSDVGADQVGAAGTAVAEHNTDENAHPDIRLQLSQFMTNVNTILNSTDEDLDQMSEIVAYIKSNKSLIESITTSKVSVTDIINNLTTNVSNKPLSAAQGVALKALIDGIKVPTNVSEFTNDVGYYNASNPPPYPVKSVNGQTEDVEIVVPTKLSELEGDSTHRVVTDAEIETWGGMLPRNQGSANVGKILTVGADGNIVLADMPEGSAGDVVGVIDENNNIVITGALADGTYTFKYETADGSYANIGSLVVSSAKYTNVLPLAQEYASSSPYVGSDGSVGYGNDKRISTSSPTATYMKDLTGVDVTAMIPVTRGDVLRFKNCNLKVTPANTSYGTNIIGFDSSKAVVSGFSALYNNIEIRLPIVTENDEIVQITLEPLATWTTSNIDNVAYIMISTDGLDETSVITINEEIMD